MVMLDKLKHQIFFMGQLWIFFINALFDVNGVILYNGLGFISNFDVTKKQEES